MTTRRWPGGHADRVRDVAIGYYRRALSCLEGDRGTHLAGLARAGVVAQLVAKREFAQALEEARKVNADLLPPDTRWAYRANVALLYHGMRHPWGDVAAEIAAARRDLREARARAQLDETDLGFVSSRKGLLGLAVAGALSAGDPAFAFDAVQDAKASLAGDALAGPPATRVEGDEVLRSARARLGKWLRFGRDERIEAECTRRRCERKELLRDQAFLAGLSAELDQLTRAYLAPWRHHRVSPPNHGAEDATGPAPNPSESLAVIRDRLPQGWALLDYWLTDDGKLTVFLLTKEGLRAEPARLPAEHGRWPLYAAALERWHAGDPRGGQELLRYFHNWLFAPVLPLLPKDVRGLYLVPHKWLHRVPLHACLGPDGYLGDKYTVAYLPAAFLLRPIPRLRLGGSILTLANAERCTALTLPFAEWEAEEVRRRVPEFQPPPWWVAKAASRNWTSGRTTRWFISPATGPATPGSGCVPISAWPTRC